MRRGAAAASLALALAGPAYGEDDLAGRVVGGAIPAPLAAEPGDPVRGRAIVADRTRGLCLLCHSGPFPEQPLQGTLAPDLSGAGSRASAGELRLRIADGRRLNPDTIMPPFGTADGLRRVGAAWRGRAILTPREIEDVVAFLATLKE